MKLSENEQLAVRKFRMRVEEELADNLIEMKLFGSKARGDAREGSDVDILVIISSDDWRICDVIYVCEAGGRARGSPDRSGIGQGA